MRLLSLDSKCKKAQAMSIIGYGIALGAGG